MALVTVGNTRIGTEHSIYYRGYWVTAEFSAEYHFLHYRIVATERSYGKKITIAFYVRYPSSNAYTTIGRYPKKLIPAVFRAENGTPVEVLSESHFTFPIEDMVDDWQVYEVYLKRDFEVGEEIWAGVWSDVLTPVWDSQSVSNGTCGANFIYTFYQFGNRADYSPYFDSGEILSCNYGAETVQGNYSLYWQYNNEPLPNDCNVTVGYPRMGNFWYTNYIIETDEGYEDEKDMEIRIEDGFLGYFYCLPKETYNKKIRIHIYHRKPVTKGYAEYFGGVDDTEVAPVVFKCDAAKNFTEVLNTEVPLLTFPADFSGWIDAELTLTRKIQAGEYIFAGFYIISGNIVQMDTEDYTGTPREHYCNTSFQGKYGILNAIRDGTILSSSITKYGADTFSCYFEYCDTLISVNYVRSVSSVGNVSTFLFRSAGLRASLNDIKSIVDNSSRTQALFRLFFDVKNLRDFSERKTDSKRHLSENGNAEDFVSRSSSLFRNFSETLGLRDFINRTIGVVVGLFTNLGVCDSIKRVLSVRRGVSSESKASSKVNAGRLIFRTVATVFGLWDWLKGKIRNENCIVELFTPITDILELECKI